MLLGAALQHAWPHDRAHHFFARARWELDPLGLAVAQLAVMLVPGPGDGLRVAVDDSVFRRAGRKVHGAGWQHDGSSPGMNKLSYGNCSREVGLPVLARLHRPGKDARPSTAETAAALVRLLAMAFPGRMIHCCESVRNLCGGDRKQYFRRPQWAAATMGRSRRQL